MTLMITIKVCVFASKGTHAMHFELNMPILDPLYAKGLTLK